MFPFRDDHFNLTGLVGSHVDGKAITGKGKFFDKQVAELLKMHCYGEGHTADKGFHHSRRFLQPVGNGPNRNDTCAQREYFSPIEPAVLDKDALAAKSERELRYGGG